MSDTYKVLNGIIRNVHDPEKCEGRWCCIHNPSPHHMHSWPQLWRDDRGIMERICPHGVGHPDPDDRTTGRVHGCDGCCIAPTEQRDRLQEGLAKARRRGKSRRGK